MNEGLLRIVAGEHMLYVAKFCLSASKQGSEVITFPALRTVSRNTLLRLLQDEVAEVRIEPNEPGSDGNISPCSSLIPAFHALR